MFKFYNRKKFILCYFVFIVFYVITFFDLSLLNSVKSLVYGLEYYLYAPVEYVDNLLESYSANADKFNLMSNKIDLLERKLVNFEYLKREYDKKDKENKFFKSVVNIKSKGEKIYLRKAFKIHRDFHNQYLLLSSQGYIFPDRSVVLDDDSLVGFVENSVKSKSVYVRLITDKKSAVPVVIDGTDLHGIAIGTGYEYLDLLYIVDDADIKVGDRVKTAQLDNDKNEDLFVGVISDVQRSPDHGFLIIKIRPEFTLDYAKWFIVK